MERRQGDPADPTRPSSPGLPEGGGFDPSEMEDEVTVLVRNRDKARFAPPKASSPTRRGRGDMLNQDGSRLARFLRATKPKPKATPKATTPQTKQSAPPQTAQSAKHLATNIEQGSSMAPKPQAAKTSQAEPTTASPAPTSTTKPEAPSNHHTQGKAAGSPPLASKVAHSPTTATAQPERSPQRQDSKAAQTIQRRAEQPRLDVAERSPSSTLTPDEQSAAPRLTTAHKTEATAPTQPKRPAPGPSEIPELKRSAASKTTEVSELKRSSSLHRDPPPSLAMPVFGGIREQLLSWFKSKPKVKPDPQSELDPAPPDKTVKSIPVAPAKDEPKTPPVVTHRSEPNVVQEVRRNRPVTPQTPARPQQAPSTPATANPTTYNDPGTFTRRQTPPKQRRRQQKLYKSPETSTLGLVWWQHHFSAVTWLGRVLWAGAFACAWVSLSRCLDPAVSDPKLSQVPYYALLGWLLCAGLSLNQRIPRRLRWTGLVLGAANSVALALAWCFRLDQL